MRKHRNNASGNRAVVRLQPLRQGLCARAVVLPGESQSDFDGLCDRLEAEWRPQTPTEQFLLEQMAVSQWKLARLERDEMALLGQIGAAERIELLERLSKIRARLERGYFKACRELERLVRLRRKEDTRQAEKTGPAEPEGGRPIALEWIDPETGERTLVAVPPGMTRRDFPGYDDYDPSIPE
jgi:hypothetical protein